MVTASTSGEVSSSRRARSRDSSAVFMLWARMDGHLAPGGGQDAVAHRKEGLVVALVQAAFLQVQPQHPGNALDELLFLGCERIVLRAEHHQQVRLPELLFQHDGQQGAERAWRAVPARALRPW